MIDVIGLKKLSADRFHDWRLRLWQTAHNGRLPWQCPACQRWMEREEYQGHYKAVGGTCAECRTRASNSSERQRSVAASARFRILRRDKFQCRYCGQAAPFVTLEVDHVIPVAKGGTSDDSNLITACLDCNRGKGVGAAA